MLPCNVIVTKEIEEGVIEVGSGKPNGHRMLAVENKKLNDVCH